MASSSIALANAVAPALLQGALMMGGLIVAIGAQNAQVLRQGMLRAHVLPVVLLCTLSDWLLVALGVFGVAAVLAAQPGLLELFGYAGAAFLLAYGGRAALQAWRGRAAGLPLAQAGGTLAASLSTTLALTYLNPHVYLDTVVLIGGVGGQHAGAARWGFVAGAWLASAAWFALLGFGSAAAARWLRGPQAWRAIDGVVAVVMWAVAAQLLLQPAIAA